MLLRNRYINFWSEKFYNKYRETDEGNFVHIFTYFKNKFCYEKYLDDVRHREFRTNLTKLRLSNHSLFIEKGCYSHPVVPRNERWSTTAFPSCPLELE
jgi:hypothetical protein